jgi:hypothetical protein
VLADPAFFLGHTTPVNDVTFGRLGSGDAANSGHKIYPPKRAKNMGQACVLVKGENARSLTLLEHQATFVVLRLGGYQIAEIQFCLRCYGDRIQRLPVEIEEW